MPRRARRIDGLRIAEFGASGTSRRRALVDAILSGRKTATAGLVDEYEGRGVDLPCAGERFVVLDVSDAPAAVIETTEVRLLAMADIDLEFVLAEGAGYASIAEWRADHARVFAGPVDNFGDDTR